MNTALKKSLLFIVMITLNIAKQDKAIKQGNNTLMCEGEDTIPTDGKCFTLHRQYVTWYEAKEYCERQGSVLATLNSYELLEKIRFKVENGHEIPAWVGAIDNTEKGKHTWVSNNETVERSNAFNAFNTSAMHQLRCLSIKDNKIEVNHEWDFCTFLIDSYVCNDIHIVNFTATCSEIGQILLDGECSILDNSTTSINTYETDCAERILGLALIKKRDQIKVPDVNLIWIRNDDKFDNKSLTWRTEITIYPKMIDRECVAHFRDVLLLDVNCKAKTHFICSDFRRGPMIIGKFRSRYDSNIFISNDESKFGSKVILYCIAETYSLPSNLTITNDEGIIREWKENITSVSLVIQKVNCTDIGQYTCEVEDIFAQQKHRKHLSLWVTGCAPRLCQQQTGGHNVSVGQVINWSLKICILKLQRESTEFLLIKDSERVPVQNMKQYKYSFQGSDTSNIHFTLNFEIFNVSWDDVGHYEIKVHFFSSGTSISYNFTIYGSQVQSGDDNLYLEIGFPLIMTILLIALGVFCRWRVVKRECVIETQLNCTGEIIDETTDYSEIIEHTSFLIYKKNDSPENILDHKVIAENFSDTCNHHEEKAPTLPPRPDTNLDYQQIKSSQKIVQYFELSTPDPKYPQNHVNMSNKTSGNVTMSNCETEENFLGHKCLAHVTAEHCIHDEHLLSSESRPYICFEKQDLPQFVTNNKLVDNVQNACGNEYYKHIGVTTKCILSGDLNADTDEHVHKIDRHSKAHIEECLNNEGVSTTSNIENGRHQQLERISYSLIGNNYIDHQYLKFNEVFQTGDPLSVPRNAISRRFNETQPLVESLISNDFKTPLDKAILLGSCDYINPVDPDLSMGLNDYITPTDRAISIASSDYITPVDADLSTELNDYITPTDRAISIASSDYITPVDTDLSTELNDYITPTERVISIASSDYITPVDTDLSSELNDYITPIHNDYIRQEIIKGKKINSPEACYISQLNSSVFDNDKVASHETHLRGTKNIPQDTFNNTVYENDDAENRKIGDNNYFVFDSDEHIQEGDNS